VLWSSINAGVNRNVTYDFTTKPQSSQKIRQCQCTKYNGQLLDRIPHAQHPTQTNTAITNAKFSLFYKTCWVSWVQRGGTAMKGTPRLVFHITYLILLCNSQIDKCQNLLWIKYENTFAGSSSMWPSLPFFWNLWFYLMWVNLFAKLIDIIIGKVQKLNCV